MKKLLLLLVLCAGNFMLFAQPEQPEDTSWKQIYRATPARINDLVHTKLDVRFDYNKSYLYGKEWITLQPHFYPTDTLTLDAKGMDIKEVSLMKGTAKTKLKYDYDGWLLKIKLDRTYKGGEKYTVYIDYTAKPDELEIEGSAAITSAKGLYFINPKGEDPDKPTQIWTQGETEGSSVWFPTIDKPNQKTTQDISMTVPAKYVTLSNGALVSQKKNADGTRTDQWKMDLPHAPYLFFMGVGDYVIVKDTYKGKEVSYYVEKEYAPVARKIFGETPAMIALYERLLGVPYPWAKYSQIVGRDYVSGAMENTTATLHQESAYQNARQLTDGNEWEDVISHELFHQWFGNIVTTESWSNITMNESLATYGEVIWQEHKYGKDGMADQVLQDRNAYMSNPAEAQKTLVRFHYNNKEDVFDLVSYQKGGTILHMLRNYVGDEAFYKALNKYLVDNKFKSAESHHLRLAFEEVTGQDLNWFWNQWYFGSGHPKLKIDYNYDGRNAQVIVEQQQKGLFKLPVAIDVYNGANKRRHKVWITQKRDTFSFPYTSKPTNINVDADKILLVDKTDNKSDENFMEQWKHATTYMDRREAVNYWARKKMPEIVNGLSDKFFKLRLHTLNQIDQNKITSPEITARLEKLSDKDSDKLVQARALEMLAKLNDNKYKSLFTKYLSDSSYTVAGAALEGLIKLDPSQAYTLAKKYSNDAKDKLGKVVTTAIMANATAEDYNFIYNTYKKAPLTQEKVQLTVDFANYLAKVKNESEVRKGVDAIMAFREGIPEQFRGFLDGTFKGAFDKLSKAKRNEGNNQLADYIGGLIK